MRFYVTIRKQGAPDETRAMEAENRFKVYDLVRDEGGYVTAIREESKFSLSHFSKFNIQFGSGVKKMEIVRLAKNLSAMISAGLSLSRALSVIERQSSNKRLKAVVVGISESIRTGASLHESLAKYPAVFPKIFVAMVKAGEESGSLTESLLVVALQMERSDELIRKIRGAMIYPAIVISVVILVGVLMLIYVVPTLTATFKSLKVQVPLATRIVVALSDFMAAHVITVFLIIAAVIAGAILFVRSDRGGRIVLSGSLKMPVIGELVRETYSARAARTLSSLLSAGVPVLEALSITKEVVHAPAFADVITEAEEHVRKGDPLSAAFEEHTKLYPVLMGDMLSVGEETGRMADMLKQIAEYYESDVAEKTKDLSTIIEPVLMVFIGAFVGVFAIAMIAPIYQLSSAI
ncbi:MAG TPA: type II secretion system F family protein [Candidatus Paceibacterota bacterium]|nr:type II secretion system F family protein [Candidatus Paceibacterota bacterium]